MTRQRRTAAKHIKAMLVAGFLVLGLSSCGEDSSNAQEPVPTPSATPTPIPTPPASGTGRIVLGDDPIASKPATATRFNLPEDAVQTADGSIYVADTHSHVIRRIKDGIVSVAAGAFQSGYNGDGDALSVKLNYPLSLLVEPTGNSIIVADAGNALLRRFDLTTNRITTIGGIPGVNSHPTIGAPILKSPVGYVTTLRYDESGNIWFISYSGDTEIFYMMPGGPVYRKSIPGISSGFRDVLPHDGVIDVLHEDRLSRLYPNGGVSTAKLRTGFGKGLSKAGDKVLVADHTALLTIDKDFSVSLFSTGFANVTNIRATSSGWLITDSDQGVIFSHTGTSMQQDVGTEASSFGALTSLASLGPSILALDNQRGQIWRLEPGAGTKELWGGIGIAKWSTPGLTRKATSFYYPNSIAADTLGNVYVSEQHRIIRINTDGVTSLYAGFELAGDKVGTVEAARFNGIGGMSFDRLGNLYICDSYNNRVKRIDPAGNVTSVAGTGVVGAPTYGVSATQSALNRPMGVLALQDGSILVADSWNNTVSRIGTDGIIRPFAGSFYHAPYQGHGSLRGDTGPALAAALNTPVAMAEAKDGTIYIVDQFNHRIRRVSSNGTIDTFAGSTQGFAPRGGLLNFPSGALVVDGNLYVADGGNRLVLEYTR